MAQTGIRLGDNVARASYGWRGFTASLPMTVKVKPL